MKPLRAVITLALRALSIHNFQPSRWVVLATGGALPAHRDGRRHRPGSSHSHRRTDRRRFRSWTVPPPVPDTLAERAAAQGAILASITDPRLVRSHRRWNDDDWTSCMAYARRADRAQQRLLD